MPISFDYDIYSLFNILLYLLWIAQSVSLILWTNSKRKSENKSLIVNLLFLSSIILLIITLINVLSPTVYLSYFGATPSEIILFFALSIFYNNAGLIIFLIITLILLFFFLENIPNKNNKVIIGPIILIIGYGMNIILNILYPNITSILSSGSITYLDSYEVIITSFVICYILSIIGMFFIYFYLICIYNEFLMIFGTIRLAIMLLSLLNFINIIIYAFNYNPYGP